MRVHRYQKVRNIADSELIFVGVLIPVQAAHHYEMMPPTVTE